MESARQATLYELLASLPEALTGEILNGQLHAQPRPSARHGRVAMMLADEIVGPFDRGRGGPGDWWIFAEPEVHFVRDIEVAVPDLAGWKRARMPNPPDDQRFEVVPDWVCEILSPSTASKDRQIKMPLYAHYGVAFAWLIDPQECYLEAYRLRSGAWCQIMRLSKEDRAAVPPFEALSLDLGELWLPQLAREPLRTPWRGR